MTAAENIATVIGALATLATVARFLGKWFTRVIGELVTQTEVFRTMTRQHTEIVTALSRIERRQLLQMAKTNGKVE